MQSFASLHDRIAKEVQFLSDKPEETPLSTLRALWFTAAGLPRSAELALSDELPPLSADGLHILAKLIEQRISGVPLPHLTARQRFMDIEMLAGPDALVPRKETELLGKAALRLASDAASRAPLVVDICTGSGNIALAVAKHVPYARVFAADLSEAAIVLAQRNAQHLGLSDRVKFRSGDLLAPFDDASFHASVDVLTCNPPYISSAKVATMPKEISEFEPRLAFDGGSLGISILMRLLQQAPQYLRSGSWLVFEVGAGQGPALVKRLKALPTFKQVTTTEDHAGVIRVIMAQC